MATPFSCKHMRGVKNDMGKYLVKRILRGILSIIAVVAIVMMLVYALVLILVMLATNNDQVKTLAGRIIPRRKGGAKNG